MSVINWGVHRSLEECQQNCRPLEGDQQDIDLAYDILAMIPEDALRLAPVDIVVIVRRLTGITVPVEGARLALTAIVDNNIIRLWYGLDGVLRDYIRPILDELDLLILEVVFETIPQPDWNSLRRRVSQDLSLIFRGDSIMPIYDRLIDEPPANLEKLIGIIQEEIVTTIYYQATGRDMHYFEIRWIHPHWDWILATYGPEIPYQDLIQE